MKKLLVTSIFVIGFLFQLKAQKKDKFSITLDLNGIKDYTNAYLVTVNKDAKGEEMFTTSDTVARTKAMKGKLKFSGKVDKDGQWFSIMIENKDKPIHMLLGNEQVKITGDFSDWPRLTISGSQGSLDLMAYTKVKDSLERKGEIDGLATYRKWYVETHPNSLYATFLILRSLRMSAKEKQMAYDKLTTYAKNSYWGVKLPENIHILTLGERIKSNTMLPDFKVSTPEGKTISILEYIKKGEFTLIDFWASWCAPCRAETPNMKKVFDAFQAKGFNIIGISTDRKEADWKKALEEERTSWFHGRDNLEEATKTLFGINAIPAFALVDNSGKLLAFRCSVSKIESFGPEIRGEGLYKTIEDLLKDKSK